MEWVKSHKLLVSALVIGGALIWLMTRGGSDNGQGAFSGVNYNDVPVGTGLLTYGSSGALFGGGSGNGKVSAPVTSTPAKGNAGAGGKAGSGNGSGTVHVTGTNISTGNQDGFGAANAAAIGSGIDRGLVTVTPMAKVSIK